MTINPSESTPRTESTAKAIVAALNELAPDGQLIRFREIRERLPAGTTPWQRLRALGVLEEREEVVLLQIRGMPHVKLSDGFDRTPDHPEVIARRGGARRIPVML